MSSEDTVLADPCPYESIWTCRLGVCRKKRDHLQAEERLLEKGNLRALDHQLHNSKTMGKKISVAKATKAVVLCLPW